MGEFTFPEETKSPPLRRYINPSLHLFFAERLPVALDIWDREPLFHVSAVGLNNFFGSFQSEWSPSLST